MLSRDPPNLEHRTSLIALQVPKHYSNHKIVLEVLKTFCNKNGLRHPDPVRFRTVVVVCEWQELWV